MSSQTNQRRLLPAKNKKGKEDESEPPGKEE
jgi:hypothetical protein